jgi:membrane-bound serine protease (ClpP class)
MIELLAVADAGMSNETMIALACVLLGLAVVLVLAEIFFVSFGLLSLAATASAVAALVLAFKVSTPMGIVFIVLEVVLIPTAIVLGLKYLPRTGWGRRLIPPSPKPEDVAATGVDNLESMVGSVGETLSMCRPAGTAEFDGERYDVVSEGLIIPRGARVKVVDVEGNRMVVREITEEEQT